MCHFDYHLFRLMINILSVNGVAVPILESMKTERPNQLQLKAYAQTHKPLVVKGELTCIV